MNINIAVLEDTPKHYKQLAEVIHNWAEKKEKPVSPEAIERCLDQYISLHSSDYYCLHKDNNITRIPFNDIISISRLGHDCCITTASGLYTERTSLKNMEQHLPEPFIRCHKSCIVNINHVTSLSGSTIYLANKQTQTVGRNYLDDVRKALLRIAQ